MGSCPSSAIKWLFSMCTLKEFYYALVRELPDPAARREYRAIIEEGCRDVAEFKFRRDLASADPAAVVIALESWAAAAPQSQSLVRRALPDILVLSQDG